MKKEQKKRGSQTFILVNFINKAKPKVVCKMVTRYEFTKAPFVLAASGENGHIW